MRRGKGRAMSVYEYTKPSEIEKRSMEIIESRLGDIQMLPENKTVLKRVIHTTADFDYVENLRFSEDAVRHGVEAFKNGAHIVTDTSMALAGINKTILRSIGGDVHCFIADPEVAAEAKARGITRSCAAVDHALTLKNELIFAVGNAPTALIRLNELICEHRINPMLVIAVSVGFVNLVEAKEAIMQSGVPYIAAAGNKGGSNVAAAICNALLYMIKRQQ